jgi:rhodanese-related sulfurtransferase/DNA-binding transcriptional ArsR family regulator
MTTPGRKYKDAIYEQLGIIGKSVASPRRLELLDLLCQGPRTVEELAGEASQSVANTSQHLQVLRASRLVKTEKKGLFVTYRLADKLVCEFFRTLRVLAESRLAEIERVTREFLEQRGVMEPMDRNTLIERVKNGEFTVIDVRPVKEYEAGHIPGSISVPLEKLEQRLADLPRDQEIVAYCRGPYCVLAIKAVELLQAKGFKAVRLEDGIPDWRAYGFKVAVGDDSP